MFLTSVRPAPELIGEGLPGVPEHMRRLGVLIAALPGGALRLPTPVTVVVGDNGAGKSTLLAESGRFSTEERDLYDELRRVELMLER